MTPIEERQFQEYMESRLHDVRLDGYKQGMEFLRDAIMNRVNDGISKRDLDTEIRFIISKWVDRVKNSRTLH